MARKKAPKPESTPKPEPKARSKRRPSESGLEIAGVPRVNLLPPSELERRAAARLVRRWIGALVVTALLVSGLTGAAHWARGLASEQLLREQNRTMTLNADLAQLAHISETMRRRDDLQQLRTEAMGNDVRWKPLFDAVLATVPGGAELTTADVLVGANPATEEDPAAIGAILQLTFQTEDPLDQDRTVDRLRKLDPVLAVEAGSLDAAGDDGISFVISVVVDQSFYSGKYAEKGAGK